MRATLFLFLSFLHFIPASYAAESPAALAEEVNTALQKNDSATLTRRRIFTVITGDIPLGRGLFNDRPPVDPDGISEPVPKLYEVQSVTALTQAEARSIEAKGYAKAWHEGYIAVEFVRRENGNPKAQITAFRRYYPYEQAATGYFLVSEK